jgi:hypothetical protein
MTKVYDIYLTESDLAKIKNRKIVKRFVGEYVLNLKKESISCPKCGREIKKDLYCKNCDIEWDEGNIV